MSYREEERRKAVLMREEVFRDPGDGVFFKKKRDFVLQEASLNLWAGIREDAIDYFEQNNILWWMGENTNEPTGHLLSSQVACVNHLYAIRQRKDIASAILKNVNREIQEATMVDDGYVEFEVIGRNNYLNERSHSRGANSTSVDAAMVGKKTDGTKVLVLIEWKYTEEYRTESKYIPARSIIYDPLIHADESPFSVANSEILYYEPFYQLMRQTLLGWKMVQHNEYSCDEFIHLHIIPEDNDELKKRMTSPGLSGQDISDAWKSALKQPQRYRIVSPEDFLQPGRNCSDTRSLMSYLEERYWRRG